MKSYIIAAIIAVVAVVLFFLVGFVSSGEQGGGEIPAVPSANIAPANAGIKGCDPAKYAPCADLYGHGSGGPGLNSVLKTIESTGGK